MRSGASAERRRLRWRRVLLATAVAGAALVLVPQALASTFIVTTNADSGPGSLRQAILDANANAGTDTITFAIGTGLQRITPASALPTITDPVVLDGTTQPSITPPGIVLDGSSCGASCNGLVVQGGGSTIKGIAVVGFSGRGVVFDGSQTGLGGNTLASSDVGWDPGTASFKNNAAAGVAVLSSPNNTIGGSDAARVVVAGNGSGGDQAEILITGTASSGNQVAGNWIGLGADGTSSPDTANGVIVTAGAHDNTIGGAASVGNTFFAFYQDAIDIRSAGSGNVVAGNSIGLDANGTVGSTDTGIGVEGSPNTTIGDSAAPPGFADTTRGNVVAGATGDVGVFVSGASDGTKIVGNFIGTDRQGASGLGNGQGIRNLDASNITIGPGNTITGSITDGVEVAGGTGTRIVANAIFGNGTDSSSAKGILIDAGANGGIQPPTLTGAAGSSGTATVTGTFTGSPNQQVFVELFGNSSCDAKGAGERYLGSGTATADGSGSAPFSISIPTGQTDTVITATATDTVTANSSEFSNCVQVTGTSPSGGSLTGDFTQAIDENVNLTSAGTSDWALWGYGLTGNQQLTALTPNVFKANGGRQISDLTQVNPSGTPPRGFGDMSPSAAPVPFGFDWSDGNSPASATGAKAGLTVPQVGEGFSFTVPADTTQRTLKVWTSAHYANGTLTATLSDGSAAPYTQQIQAFAGQFPTVTENVPTVFTLNYAAASAGQTLKVTWTQDTNNGCAGCDDVVLYAAALSGGGNATAVSATLKPGNSVPISGANDKLTDLSIDAFAPQQSGVTPAPLNGLPLNGLPLNGLPLNGLPLNGLPLNGLPLNGLPLNGLPLNGLPLNGLPLNGLPLNGLPLNGLPLNGLSWQTLLAGTPLAGLPLQTVTLQQVLALPNPPPAVVNLKLGDLQLDTSNLGKETIGALALGSTPLNALGAQAASIETQMQTWCEGVTTSPDPATACSLANIGNQSLFALGLAGAPLNGLPLNGLPLNGLPLNGLPLNGLPLNGLDLSASPLNGLPLNGLPLNGLFTCGTCSGLTIGQAIAAGDFAPGTTLGQLLAVLLAPTSPVRDSVTLGDVIAFLIDRSSVPWETLSPRLLSLFDPSRPTLPMTAAFTVQGTGSVPVTLKLTLPDGFDYDPSTPAVLSATGLPDTNPAPDNVVGPTITWSLPSVQTGTSYQLSFRVRSGTTVGPAQGTLQVASGSLSDSSTQPFAVTDSFAGNGTPATATTITPDQNVELSTLPTAGAVDYYKVPLPPAGTRLQVHLTNLAADYDLALYASQTTSVRTTSATGVPLQDGTVADQPLNLQGGVNSQLSPTALQDVPDPGIPVVQVSANRGTDDEDVGMVSPGGGGYATIAVFGYNGAFSPKPYTLRVTTKAPQTLTCPARTFPGGGTPGATLPTLTASTNTLFLVDEKRIGDTYGATAESNVVAKLTELAGRGDLGVSGAVVPVEAIAGAQAQYNTWDSNPCDVTAANAVANTIANYVASAKAAHPTIKYVVFVGGDDQVPFFRLPDLSLIANESGFASAFGKNEYFGALASGDLLSDDPYLDTRPIPASGRQLFVPDLVGGRLVEKPDQIVGAITRFEQAQAILRSSTAFVSGYDFVKDGSALVQSRLASTLGTANVRSLINDTWSKTDLYGAAFPTGGPAAINDWNGHYDNHQALAANGDQTNLISTGDLTGSQAFNGGIFFTMGCHAGFQTTDAIVGGAVLDWAEYFAGTGTGFVGNTGFGIGNTDSVAFSEELMADLAGHLDGSLSIGDALTQAKRDYYLSRTAYSSYDEKTLSEAELYGLPMYGVGKAPTALPAPASPDPVVGSSSSTSPSQGVLAPLAGTSGQVASFDVTPQFSAVQTGQHGQYLTNAGQVQAPNYRPLQPYVTLPATRDGLVAHGVLIDGLTSSDITPFDPDNVRPTVDLTKSEPEPQFADEAWPVKVPTLVSLQDSKGLQQSLNLATGQFFVDSATKQGVERKWTRITGHVIYSTSTSFDPPEIDSVDAFLSNGRVVFTGQFSDAGGAVKLARVVYDSNNSGTWVSLPLQAQAGGSWAASAPFTGTQVQFFVEACDDAGNCGFSSNKGRYFNASPLPSGTGGSITLAPARAPDVAGVYTSPVAVTVTSTGGPVSVTLDGTAVTLDAQNSLTVTGDGVHVVEATAADGSRATGVYLIDTSPPGIVFTGIEAKTYPIADLPPASAVGCVVADLTGGTCSVSGYSGAYGAHTLTATATDGTGRTSTATLTYVVGLKSGDILAPMAAASGDQTDQNAKDLSVSKINSTLPLKFQMYLDGARKQLMTTPPAGSIARLAFAKADSSTDSSTTTVIIDSTTADSGNVFAFDGGQYHYNLKTKGLTAGTYYVTITVYAADGTTVLAQSAKQYFVLRS